MAVTDRSLQIIALWESGLRVKKRIADPDFNSERGSAVMTATNHIPPATDRPDYRRNADLAHRISEYWAARGYSVKMNIVNEGYFTESRCAVHGVRSDMVRGMPVKKIGAR